jgi:hypothetical protein
MLVTLPTGYALKVMRNEVAWSFHAVFLIPIAVGLLASIFKPGFFGALALWKRCVWILAFLAMVALLFSAVAADTKVIPPPDRISSGNGLQAFAIKVDTCLRNDCSDTGKYLALVPKCIEKYGHRSGYKALHAGSSYIGTDSRPPGAGFRKRQAYFCAMLEKTGGRPVPGNTVASLVFALKYALIIFVWSFIYYTFFVAANYFFRIEKDILYSLLGCFVIFLTWFPCQLYAEWYEWYGDLSHIFDFYSTFWVLLVIAVLLLLLFTAWATVLLRKANLITTIAAVHSTTVAVFAIILGTRPETLGTVFELFRTLPNPIFLVLMFIVLLYIVVYMRLVMSGGSPMQRPPGAAQARGP